MHHRQLVGVLIWPSNPEYIHNHAPHVHNIRNQVPTGWPLCGIDYQGMQYYGFKSCPNMSEQ